MLSLLIQWLVIVSLFILVLGNINPLARLYERQPLIKALSPDYQLSHFYIFSSLLSIRIIFPHLQLFKSKFILEIGYLLRKDLLLLERFSISLNYSFIMTIYFVMVVLWFLTEIAISPILFVLGFIQIVFITLFLWEKESKAFLQHFDISFPALITEKSILSFILAITILVPFLILNNLVVFLSGFCLYAISFGMGTIYYTIIPSHL